MNHLATRELTITGICIALAVAAGFIFLHIPNLELITTVSFLSGLILGSIRGSIVGGISMFLFSLFNPLGVPFLPVFAAQIIFMALAGYSGGLWRRVLRQHSLQPVHIPGLAVTGLILTLLYDVGTNAGFALGSGLWSQMFTIIAGGILFSSIHLVTNTVLFATLVPAAAKVLKVDAEHGM